MNRSHSRLLSRELRQRVDAIHRAYDRYLRSDSSNLNLVFPTAGTPLPFSLAEAVKQVVSKHRKYSDNDTTKGLLARAQGLAASFEGNDPNPLVQATWATERAQMELSRSLPFDHAVPHTFISGKAYNNYLDPITGRYLLDKLDFSGLHKDDLKTLENLTPTAVDDVITASWTPAHPCRVWDADCMRPPMECLSLIRDHIIGEPEDCGNFGIQTQTLNSGSVLAIGLGFSGPVQSLSSMLPHHYVSHIPVPYFLPTYDLDRLIKQTWDLVILGIPSHHSWQVATMLAGQPDMTFIQRRDILQGKLAQGQDPIGHVPELVELVHRFLKSEATLALVGDPEPYYATIDQLQSKLNGPGLANRATWVDYQVRPWAPHQIPGPTGKLVSFWSIR